MKAEHSYEISTFIKETPPHRDPPGEDAMRSLCPAKKSSPDSPQLKQRKLAHSNEDLAQPKGNRNFLNSNLGIKHKSLTKV